MNFRSCSGEPNRLLRSYHSGETDDPRRALHHIRDRVRGPLAAVGFSLGGNVLLKLLAEDGDRSPLAAAAAVSVPYDLGRCAAALDAPGGFASLYRRRFLRTLKAKARGKAVRHSAALDLGLLRALATITAFDDLVTARVHGFSGAADYYARCSSGPLLGAIRRPTLLLGAKDDPMVPASSLPTSAEQSASLFVHWTERGGHVGFIDGAPWRPGFWAERMISSFLERQLQPFGRNPSNVA